MSCINSFYRLPCDPALHFKKNGHFKEKLEAHQVCSMGGGEVFVTAGVEKAMSAVGGPSKKLEGMIVNIQTCVCKTQHCDHCGYKEIPLVCIALQTVFHLEAIPTILYLPEHLSFQPQ